MKPKIILDASALVAYVEKQSGYITVRKAIPKGVAISTVNLSESYAILVSHGWNLRNLISHIFKLNILILPFGENEARIAAQLYQTIGEKFAGQKIDISFADRACLASGIRLKLPVLTYEKDWLELDLAEPEIQLID